MFFFPRRISSLILGLLALTISNVIGQSFDQSETQETLTGQAFDQLEAQEMLISQDEILKTLLDDGESTIFTHGK